MTLKQIDNLCNNSEDYIEALKAENEQLKTALGKALDNGTFAPHIKSVLDFHRQEFPFEPGDNTSEQRERYYWLSGFLNAYLEELGEDSAFGVPLRQRQLEEENKGLKKQIAELQAEIESLNIQIDEIQYGEDF